MPDSSLRGGIPAPEQAAGRDTDALGPSDTSDTGSDVQGELDLHDPAEVDDALGTTPAIGTSDTDSSGTGELASASGDESLRPDADILPDRIESMLDAADTSAPESGELDRLLDELVADDDGVDPEAEPGSEDDA